ncbi:MAG: DUF4870 domain-containing protein [Phycisphaerales bacterium JB064]
MTAAQAWYNQTYAEQQAPPSHVDGKLYVDPQSTDRDRQWALWTHLAPLMAAVVSSGTLAPLGIVWGLYIMHMPGKERPFVADHGREMFNFSVSYLIYWTVGSAVVGIVSFGAALIVYLPFLVVMGVLCPILAAVAGAKGRYYRYPMTIRFMKAPYEKDDSQDNPPQGQAA